MKPPLESTHAHLRLLLRSAGLGLAMTLFTMLFPYRYCDNGPGRGLPFAVYAPSCGATFAAVGGRSDGQPTQVVDLAKLLGNVLLWGGGAAGVLDRLSRPISRSASRRLVAPGRARAACPW